MVKFKQVKKRLLRDGQKPIVREAMVSCSINGILKDMPDDTKSKLAKLEKELYSKDFKPHKVDDSLDSKEIAEIPSWDISGDAVSFLDERTKAGKRHKMMKNFLFISIAFFVLAATASGFIWWRGLNIISGENIVIDITVPTTVVGGDSFETKLLVTNNNKVSVEAATLYIEYPSGFYSADDKSELPRTTKDLGPIVPGQVISESINTLLYGEENTQKDVNVVLEYRMAGSNATQKKSATYSVKVSSSPINVRLSMLKEASSGQEIEMSIDVTSNSRSTQDNMLLEAVYPFGFSLTSSDPEPTYGTNIWDIGTLTTQEKRTIKIRGIIEGRDGEEKVSKVSVGSRSQRDERSIGVVYNTTTETLAIMKPFLSVGLAVDGDPNATEYSVPFGKGIRADVFWQSNNPTKITDAVIEVKVKGDVLNRFSVYASNGGFYNSINDTITWDKTGDPSLAVVEPGAKGGMSFSFSPTALGVDATRIIKNPQITLEVKARARRASDVGVSGEVATFVSRKIKIETDIRLAVKGLYFSGPFMNTGPLPPKAEKETTYTVVWTVRNASNNVSNVSVKTTLPVYVKWLGRVSPDGEEMIYNENGAEVTWNVGRIPAGGTREAAFQISFLPSLSQVNQAPQLTGDSFLSGLDDFVKTNLQVHEAPIRIMLPSDPQFSSDQGTVVE